MILDTSALAANAAECRITVANFLELCMVIEGGIGAAPAGSSTYFCAVRESEPL